MPGPLTKYFNYISGPDAAVLVKHPDLRSFGPDQDSFFETTSLLRGLDELARHRRAQLLSSYLIIFFKVFILYIHNPTISQVPAACQLKNFFLYFNGRAHPLEGLRAWSLTHYFLFFFRPS